MDLESKVTTEQCPVRKAYERLVEMASGREKGIEVQQGA